MYRSRSSHENNGLHAAYASGMREIMLFIVPKPHGVLNGVEVDRERTLQTPFKGESNPTPSTKRPCNILQTYEF